MLAPPEPGAAVTCRPPIIVGSPHWALGVDWTTGATFGDLATENGAEGLGVELTFPLLRSFELGARYELLDVGLSSAPRVPGSNDLSNQFFALAKVRLFDDEIRRHEWTIGAGAGYALRGDLLGGSAPIVRGSIARALGMYVGQSNAVTAAVELSYEQSLGPQKLSAVLASLRFGFEINIRKPRGLGERAPTPWLHTTSFEVFAGPNLGGGLSLGLRASPSLSLETSGAFLFGYSGGAEHGIDGAAWSLQTGPRVLLPWPAEYAPLYAQLQGGAAWVADDPHGELHAIATAELGLQGFVGCGAVDLGGWLRANVDHGVDVIAGGAVLRTVFGSGVGAVGGHRIGGCNGREPHLATAPPIVTTPEPGVPSTSYTVDLNPPNIGVPNVNIDVNAGGTVSIPKPQPVVVEVDLGAVFFGMQVRIDPRVLPFDRLRGAGWITVELSGPADGLAQFQGQLSATLSRSSIRVDGWTSIVTDGSVVHARFTIWPPGTRP
ncbi:MAG: hypothetical protein JWO36_7495 [Myxococcales bacterium]|nr:hypothetical protein [Myxococcales bacterium]